MKRYDRFAKVESHLAWSVLDALETTSRRLLLTGRRLLTLVQSDDPRIRFERVGSDAGELEFAGVAGSGQGNREEG